ncbi:MAG: RNA polymerase sigma factor [Cyanobacteriota/Melainabacteria group bacterium]
MSHQTKNRDSLRDLSDQELIALTLAGNDRSFETLVRRHQKQVYNFVYQMTRNHDESADMTQETFLKVYRALGSFDKEREFKPWLLRIARNSTLNQIRRQKPDASLDDGATYIELSTGEDASRRVEENLSRATFEKALSDLPDSQRDTFMYKYHQDLSYQEISDIMGISISSIKSLLFRARDSLRKRLSLGESGLVEEQE